MPRVVLFGAAWTLMLAALLFAFRPEPRPAVATHVGAPRPEAPPPPPKAGQRYAGWSVTRAYSAHHAMVVEVETERPATALAIAAQVVEPLKDRYEEVLLYVRTPDTPSDALAERRVQWTKRGGYTELVYGR